MRWIINQLTPKGSAPVRLSLKPNQKQPCIFTALHLWPEALSRSSIPAMETLFLLPLIRTAHREMLSAMSSLLKTLMPLSDRSPIGLFIICPLIFNSCRKRLSITLPFLMVDYMVGMILLSWGLVVPVRLKDLTATCSNSTPLTNP